MDSNLQKTQNAPTFGGMDAEAIAAGLSEAQRELVTSCRDDGTNRCQNWHSPIKALIKKGVLIDDERLTPLGHSVRAILLRDQGEE